MWLIRATFIAGLVGMTYAALGPFGTPTVIRLAWGMTVGVVLVLALFRRF